MFKNCSKPNCTQINPQPIENFYPRKSKAGVRSECITCCKLEYKSNYNSEKAVAYQKAWVERNPEKYKIVHKSTKLRKYWPGLSGVEAYEKYMELFIAQKGNCALCERNRKEFRRDLSVDHCHKTGKVRGLLCDNCNFAIGLLSDNVKIFPKIQEYLK